MKIKSNDKTVSKKQGIVNIGYFDLTELRCRINELKALKPYLEKSKHWIIDIKIEECNRIIENMQDIIHTLSNIQPMRHQL